MLRTSLPCLALIVWSCTKPAVSTPVDAGTSSIVAALDGDAGIAVRFVALGDTGKGNAGQKQVGASVGAVCAANGCDFVVLLGDNFYPTGVESATDPQWKTKFVEPYASVDAPFYAVLGNHDCGGDGAGTDLPRGDNQLAYALVDPKWRMPARHYQWQVGDVAFFAADTNRSMFGVDEDLRGDFEKWLPASTAKWKIVFAHHPLKSNGEHGNAGSYDGLPFVPVANGASVKSFVEERVCGLADLYVTGHDHSLQWLEATCSRPGSALQTQLIVSGGGAAATTLPGKQPTHYQSDKLGFVYVVLRGNSLTASFFDANGVQQYTRTVRK